MRLLAIDTATPRPSLTVLSGDSPPSTFELPRLGAEALAPTVSAALAASGLAPRDLDRIAVVSGPGSFTGLRSALAFGRGLARAVSASLVRVPTFDAASEAFPSPADLDFVLDALRGEVHRRKRRGGVLEDVETRLNRADAEVEAAASGVSLVDLGSASLLLSRAAAFVGRRAGAEEGCAPRYGRPPAAEERFGPDDR